MNQKKKPIQALTREELQGWLHQLEPHAKPHLARIRAQQIFNWLYQRHVESFEAMSDVSKKVRASLEETFEIRRLEKETEQLSDDGTRKFLWKLEDGETIESVLIPAQLADSERLTLCISSQVGCAMGCRFCLTATQGLKRSLRVEEIVSQVWEVRKLAPVTNIVFMGMGEPLHNLDHVIAACKIVLDAQGLNFSKRKVTVSTSGLVPAIKTLAESVDVLLAVSLNGTTDEQREKIMPVNRKWKIAELLEACRAYQKGAGRFRRVTFEYVLLSGVNDSMEDARRLAKLVGGIPSKINLIPFNEHQGSGFQRPSDGHVLRFQRFLLNRGLTTTIRHSRGRDISAACGQLRSAVKENAALKHELLIGDVQKNTHTHHTRDQGRTPVTHIR